MKSSRINRVLLTLFAFVFLAVYQRFFGLSLPVQEKTTVLSEQTQASSTKQISREEAQVLRVVDGDTLQVLVASQKDRY